MGMAVTYPAENFDESGEWNTEKQAAACATLYVQSFHIGFGRVPVGCDRVCRRYGSCRRLQPIGGVQ